MPINKNEITKEQILKAMKCKSADELMALAKAGGFDITKDEAAAYMAELADFELDGAQLKNVAGGGGYEDCPSDTCWHYCPADYDRK